MHTKLKHYGLTEHYETLFNDIALQQGDLVLGRVISVHRTQYEIITEEGNILAHITGNRLKDKDSFSKPVVGDWVAVQLGRNDDANLIVDLLPRNTVLHRRRPHSDDIQVMAANVDIAVIMQSVIQDLNIARIERVLVQLRDAGISPIVVFNKIDLLEDIGRISQELSRLPHVPIIMTSTVNGEGIDTLRSYLEPTKTVVFLGSSGVGKSSMLNMLEPNIEQKTGAISTYSGKGMHTTTARKLFLLDNGALVIDTPGTREFGLTLDDDTVVKDQFDHIETLSRSCKFRDCKHMNEPGCAVIVAAQEGDIDEAILRNYQKLLEEVRNRSSYDA